MDQQFSLTWNNFHGNLTKGFAGLLGNAEFVDVTIAVEGHLLQAHKVILSICSPYFKKMFQTNPCQHPIVVLRDVSHKAMRDLLQFMYHGEVSVKREDLNSFIGTAELLQIKGLTNRQADEDHSEKEPELPSYIDKLNNQVETESTASDSFDTTPNNDAQSNEQEIVKQREFIERLQRFSNLKRKSNEFLQKNFYSDMLITEKKAKLKETTIYNRPNSQLQQNSNAETLKKFYDDNLVDITTSLNTHAHKTMESNKNNMNMQEEPQVPVEVKTECDDDIIVTDPAVCNTPKEYDNPKNTKKDSFVPMDFQLPQDNCTSLSSLFMDLKNLVNGKVPMLRNSLEMYPTQSLEHRLTTIPQKEDGKKKYPQRSCRLCWKIGKRRDTRFMCSACELPFCKSPCFDIHCSDMPKATHLQSALSLVVNNSSDDQLPARYKYIYSRKGHKQLVHMNFVYTKHSTTHGKTSWRCVQYFSLNRCPATVETIDNMIYAVNHQHNHEDCYEKLSRNNIYEMNSLPK